jgi:RNA exonuclease 4
MKPISMNLLGSEMALSRFFLIALMQMVGVGPEGLESAVARVAICNWAEEVILDTFVKVPVEVTDYRTFVSGIEAKDLDGDGAMPLMKVRKMVKNILHGKILIGHALENDLAALQIIHPWHDIRDSANYPPYMKEGEIDATVLRPRKLKELVRDKLGRDIQNLGEAHDPIEDARAALSLYKLERLEWERLIMKQVASARVKEGREIEPSGRDSPYNGYRPPVAAAAIGPKNANYSQSFFFRSRSAPTTGMIPHQGYYVQQHFSY